MNMGTVFVCRKEGRKILMTWAGLGGRWHSCPCQKLPVSFHCPGMTGYVSSAALQRTHKPHAQAQRNTRAQSQLFEKCDAVV